MAKLHSVIDIDTPFYDLADSLADDETLLVEYDGGELTCNIRFQFENGETVNETLTAGDIDDLRAQMQEIVRQNRRSFQEDSDIDSEGRAHESNVLCTVTSYFNPSRNSVSHFEISYP